MLSYFNDRGAIHCWQALCLAYSKVKTTRREFLNAGATMVGVASAVSAVGEALFSPAALTAETVPPPTRRKANMIYRSLGRTGAQISALGVGGHHLGDLPGVDEAIRLVHEAIDAGITFFDNCWEYYNGKTENILGRALKGRRQKVFLMTKVCTHGRSAQLALQMLEESLRRMQTEHLYIWSIKGIVYG